MKGITTAAPSIATIAVSGSQLDVAGSAIGPKNQQFGVVATITLGCSR